MPTPFPFSAIVGQDEMKLAILAVAVDPSIGGVLVFGEPFPRARAIGFVLIWAALAFYAADSLWRSRK